jgi:hypothetical protein
MAEPKPGLKTTEFYFNAVIALAGIAASAGIISPEFLVNLETASPEMQEIINNLIHGATRLVGLVVTLFAGKNYTASRVAAKRGAK